VYGTVIIGVDTFRGPRLSLGKRSWGLLIRRVISARVRRTDEIERASNSASAASSYWDVVRGAGAHWFIVYVDRKPLGAREE
jgi:hypothetical protein